MVRPLVLWVRLQRLCFLAGQEDRCAGGQDALPGWSPSKCGHGSGKARGEGGICGRAGP